MSVEVKMPQMGESVAEGTILRWLVKKGDRVEKDQSLFEISTDKVDAEIPSPEAGTLLEILVPEGETVEVGRLVALIGAAEEAAGAGPSAEARGPRTGEAGATEPLAPVAPGVAPPALGSASLHASPAADPAAGVRSSPVARRIAREHGVDIERVPGTAHGGRVSKKDVLRFVEAGRTPSGRSEPPAPEAPLFAPGEESVVLPMSVMRRKIAEHMTASKRTSPHVLTVFEIDVTRAQRLRAAHKDAFESRHGARLTLTTMVVHAIIPSILRFPVVNASVSGDSIVYHKAVNVGIAVALDDGLIVPVIKRAERLGIGEIARAIQDLSRRARARKLVPEDVQGATFTITNPGPYGALFNFPVINQPNVAILGMGGARKKPVVVDDAIAIREIACFSLSFDHRAIDGAVADQFMASFRERLEGFPEEALA